MRLRFIQWLKEHKYIIALLLFTAGLLFYRVSWRTFWMDETMVLNYLQYSLPDFVRLYIELPDNHPPLYYLLVLLVAKVLPLTELTIRLVSVVSGLIIVGLVYLFTWRVSSRPKVALTAAFFTAFSSYFILISQMARYHALAAAAALATLYFFYCLYQNGYTRRAWLGYVIALTITGFSDYPHFIYVALITNAVFWYCLARRRSFISLGRWLGGQAIVAILCSPMVWFIYHRVYVQGDGGWGDMNLLGNSGINILGGIAYHFYNYFFGENIFPWNYLVFGAGLVVAGAVLAGWWVGWRRAAGSSGETLVLGMAGALIVLNTIFMNVADARYNFIAYPRFGFVAYPVMIMALVLGVYKLRSEKIQSIIFWLWTLVALFGLTQFYQAKNYLNGSYFRTFESFEYVRAASRAGDYLAITPDASEGLYLFYQTEYFSRLRPLYWREFQSSTVPLGSRVWFFATASDSVVDSVDTSQIIPAGYSLIEQFDSTALDPTFKALKEKFLRRPSYTYKYTVFLLEKI